MSPALLKTTRSPAFTTVATYETYPPDLPNGPEDETSAVVTIQDISKLNMEHYEKNIRFNPYNFAFENFERDGNVYEVEGTIQFVKEYDTYYNIHLASASLSFPILSTINELDNVVCGALLRSKALSSMDYIRRIGTNFQGRRVLALKVYKASTALISTLPSVEETLVQGSVIKVGFTIQGPWSMKSPTTHRILAGLHFKVRAIEYVGTDEIYIDEFPVGTQFKFDKPLEQLK